MTGRDGAGPKLRDRDAGLVLERRAERAFELFGQLLARQHGRRLKYVELAARFSADGCHFLEVQIGIDEHVDGRASEVATR